MDGTIPAFSVWLVGQLRERRLSQESLAQRCGVHRSTISRLVNGQRRPSLDTARRLAEALDPDGPFHRHWSHDPVMGVERALAADPGLSPEGRSRLMRAYLEVRSEPAREGSRRG